MIESEKYDKRKKVTIMANRPVFTVSDTKPYCRQASLYFEWNAGFSKTQKMKNVEALHHAYLNSALGKGKKILEISSKSSDPNGVAMSAFNLKKYVPSLDRMVTVECIFQAGKVFSQGGPYLDLLESTSRAAKKDERLYSSGKLIAFEFEGERYPLEPKTAFYDWIYINACMENEELSDYILQFDAFSDIEFNPERSINCQARTCAKYVSLKRLNLIDKDIDFDTFVEMFY